MTFFRKTIWQRFRYIINIPRSAKLVWHLMRDKRVPTANKGLFSILILVYLLSPIDLIPDYIPVIGQLDDFGLILFMMDRFISKAPTHVVAEYVKK